MEKLSSRILGISIILGIIYLDVGSTKYFLFMLISKKHLLNLKKLYKIYRI